MGDVEADETVVDLGEEPLTDLHAETPVCIPSREEMLACKAPEHVLTVMFRDLGWKFELRRLRSLQELDEVQTQIRMLQDHPGVKVEGRAEPVTLTPMQAVTIAWVRSCLVEPQLSTADVVAISLEHGYVISTLANYAIAHNGADGSEVETAKND